MTREPVLCGRCGTEQTTDPAPLCHPCTNTLGADLTDTPAILDALQDATARLDRIDRPGAGTVDDTRRTLDGRYPLTAATTRLPVSLTASDAAHAIEHAIRQVAARLPNRSGPHPAVLAHPADLALWLARRVTGIRHHEWSPNAAHAIARDLNRGRAIIDTPGPTWFAGTCDTQLHDPDHPDLGAYLCGWHLYPPLTSATVRCRGCGTLHDVQARRDAMLLAARHVLVTAADAARALSTPTRPVTAAMIRGWKHRGHLEAPIDPATGRPAVTAAGQPLYRLADVQTVDATLRYGTVPGRAS